MRFYLLLCVFLLSACSLVTQKHDANAWHYATDPHGSYAEYDTQLVTDEHIAVRFFRVPRVDKQNNSWVELIYDLPTKSLVGSNEIELTYQSDKPLIIKLSQAEYGAKGDGSYAHYQISLPSAESWRTERVAITQFTRPDWTPTWSPDKGIVHKHISALYFVPSLTDEDGGSATITIKSLTLL